MRLPLLFLGEPDLLDLCEVVLVLLDRLEEVVNIAIVDADGFMRNNFRKVTIPVLRVKRRHFKYC